MEKAEPYKAAQHLARIGSWDWEMETNTVTWSEELYRLFGRDPKLPPPDGQAHSALYIPESWQRLDKAVQHAQQTGEPYDLELQIVRPDGTHRWVIAKGEAVRDVDQRIIQLLGTVQDITERKLLEEQRRISQEAAEQARRQSEAAYLAGISHEIRTPMQSIMGLTELTLETKLDRERRECLQAIKASGEALLHILEDLLDFSQLEARTLTLVPRFFGLRKEMGEIIRRLVPQTHEKQLEMFCEIAAEVPEGLFGDPVRLRQLVTNLLTHSIKNRAHGEVYLVVQKEAERDDGVILHGMVRDRGLDLAASHPEWSSIGSDGKPQSLADSLAGAGLGVRVAAGLAELMNGRLWVEEETEKSRTFHFTADFSLAPQPEAPGAGLSPALRPQTVKVLLVEAHPATQRIVGNLLTKLGLQPTVAPHDEQALVILRRAAVKGRPIPLILLDAGRSGKDGLERVKKMRAELFPDQQILLMLKAPAADPEMLPAYRQAGASWCLPKPILEENLHPIVEQFLAENPLVQAETARKFAASLPPGFQSLRILVVEDNPVNQVVLIRMLQKMGHQATAEENGQEALLRLEKEPFDLVLMDIQMPVMDGWEATAAIRAKEVGTGRHIPIVAVTAHVLPQDRDQSRAAGMDDFLAKPVRSNTLVQAIGVVMRKPERSDGNPGKS